MSGRTLPLTREELAARLARAVEDPAMLVRLLRRDEGADADRARVPAAVLVPILERPGGPTVLLIRRTAHLRDHAGQVSLPGGRIEAEDADVFAAALREAQEEVGLDPAAVRFVACLPYYDTVTGYRVHPVVGWVERPPERFTPDPFEVEEVFEVPLAHVLDPSRYRREGAVRGGRRREWFVLEHDRHHIWGATAGILLGLARLANGRDGREEAS